MRFAWKVFFGGMLVVIAAFSAWGYVLTSAAFQTALKQEQARALDQFGLLVKVVSSMTERYGYFSSTSELASTMRDIGTGEFASARLYLDDGAQVYPEKVQENPLFDAAREGTAYRIAREGDAYLFRCSAPVQLGVRAGMLYWEREIGAPFRLAEEMASANTGTMLVTLGVVGALLLALSYVLTKPVRVLSSATREFALGNYEKRAAIRGRDEIGALAEDFNHMADALQGHMHQLEEQARQREDFVASFAHELKTPLTSIIGYADMLRSQDMEEERRFHSANYIFTEGRRLERLSFKLLELMVLNRQEFERYSVQAEDIFLHLEDAAGAAIYEKYGVTLSLSFAQACILAEPDLLDTMLINLVENAAKASESGQSVRLTGALEQDGYRVTVRDNGRGIPREELSRITEAFYTVEKSRARRQNGAGLGLALCATIAKLHGTAMIFTSESGRGTEVSFLLPYGEEDAYEA